MADLSITPGSVLRIDGSTEPGIAGEDITAGQVVYLDSATNTYKLADANGASAAVATVQGIALHGALTGQPLLIHLAGIIAVGATVVLGGAYILSATPGGICPYADIASASYVSYLGIAVTTARIRIKIDNSLIQHA